MRRCYRSVALVLGSILFTSNTFSNSCSLATLNVYAAENALAEEVRLSEAAADTVNIPPEEENVETEIPAEESDPAPTAVEENNEKSFYLKNKEYNVLLKIVEAEAGCEDITGRMLVANVIMNRVNSDIFPDTVTEVVYQRHRGTAQFSPTADGRIDTVTVSPETIEAVDRVMNGEDCSNGALYFRSAYCNSQWHDQALTRVLEHGNHIFYL